MEASKILIVFEATLCWIQIWTPSLPYKEPRCKKNAQSALEGFCNNLHYHQVATDEMRFSKAIDWTMFMNNAMCSRFEWTEWSIGTGDWFYALKKEREESNWLLENHMICFKQNKQNKSAVDLRTSSINVESMSAMLWYAGWCFIRQMQVLDLIKSPIKMEKRRKEMLQINASESATVWQACQERVRWGG